mgnify:CR=1 FL=1
MARVWAAALCGNQHQQIAVTGSHAGGVAVPWSDIDVSVPVPGFPARGVDLSAFRDKSITKNKRRLPIAWAKDAAGNRGDFLAHDTRWPHEHGRHSAGAIGVVRLTRVQGRACGGKKRARREADVAAEARRPAGPDPVDAILKDTNMADTAMTDTADAGDCDLLTIDNALGEACDNEMTAICSDIEPSDIALVCFQGHWAKLADLKDQFPFGCFCQPNPDPCAYAFAACAVPGFVGLDRSARPRLATRSLRMRFPTA